MIRFSVLKDWQVMAQELVCKGNHIMFKPFDEDFLLHQRLQTPALSPRASACYTPVQDLESKQLLKNFIDGSNDFPKLFERFTASVVYSITFGMRVITGEEWQLKESHACLGNMVKAGTVGAWIVDMFPFLNHLPPALAPWKKTAEEWYERWAKLHMTNFQDAQKRDGWNWAKDFKLAKEAQDLTDMQIAWDLGILCDAGVETTNIQLQNFVLACTAFGAEFIPKAQAELDRVVGPSRLPNFEDLENLPYVQAVVEENFRWRHIVPSGIPHATSADDHYKGYFIPKGSLVIALFSGMRKDARVYEEPSHFRPERWLSGKAVQPSNWGYGRRVCPGRFIARNSLAIAIARMLWAFNIRSKDGKKVVVTEESFTDGFVSGPKPFEAIFECRSSAHRKIIEDSFQSSEKDLGVLMNGVRKEQLTAGLSPRA